MSNQNNSPLVITETVNVQAGQTTDFIDISSGMEPNEQMNVFGIYCEVIDGDTDLGDINDDTTHEHTYTDIDDVYIPSRDHDEYGGLPLCCNPRPGMGEAMNLLFYIGDHPLFRGNFIPLALFNNRTPELFTEWPNHLNDVDCSEHTSKILIFKEPLTIYPSERFRIKVQSLNPLATTGATTYSQVRISFLTEVINKAETLKMLKGEDIGQEG